MSSDAQINQKLLDDERAKPLPDPDIIYALETTKDYWNTIDNNRISKGFDKLKDMLPSQQSETTS